MLVDVKVSTFGQDERRRGVSRIAQRLPRRKVRTTWHLPVRHRNHKCKTSVCRVCGCEKSLHAPSHGSDNQRIKRRVGEKGTRRRCTAEERAARAEKRIDIRGRRAKARMATVERGGE